MEKEVITSYKGFNPDMTCRGFQYEVGKEYHLEGEVRVCENGFHACENPLDVLDYYNHIEGKYCIVEQSGDIKHHGDKLASSEIKIKAEIGFVGLFNAGIEWLKKTTKTREYNSSGDNAKISSGGNYAQISSGGDYAVICCAGLGSKVKAKKGSWITLTEWSYSVELNDYSPVCVKTEQVDGERIKEDTWYMLKNGEFVECSFKQK